MVKAQANNIDRSQKVYSLLVDLGQILSPKEIKGNRKFTQLCQCYDTDEVLLYAPISQFIYNYEYETGGFIQALTVAVNETYADQKQSSVYQHLQKMLDHMNLAQTQKRVLVEQQLTVIDGQQKKLGEITDQLEQSKDVISKLEERAAKIEERSQKITFDYVTILGIFTSITFATFGGLQLLGNVFGKVASTSHEIIGSELMLGAVFLFGTYLILVALLTGISKLVGRQYTTTFPTRYLMVLSFAAIFIVGLIYANSDLLALVVHHWVLAMVTVVICMVISLGIESWYQHYDKK